MKNRLLLLILPLAAAAHAQPSSCSSDGQRPPTALLERFINADCETCWGDKQAPGAATGAIAIDWVTPGARGDDAPLSAVATRDGEYRLEALARKAPVQSASVFTQRAAGAPRLRVAHGPTVSDYIGTSIELHGAGKGVWKAWLLLVETLPAGTEGSTVERNLVRNAFMAEWKGPASTQYELRPMRIAEGAKPSRLRVVGWVEDGNGKLRAIAQSHCAGR